MRKKILTCIAAGATILLPFRASGEVEPIKFGNFESWYSRDITESKLLGGNTKRLYEIAPNGSTTGNNAYVNKGGSPWATSNVYANIPPGIAKGATAVGPATMGGSKVAKMETMMEHVKALGINMDVIVQGTIFLGRIYEPIRSTKSPFSKMEMGMPYKRKPKAVQFDYRVDLPKENKRVKSTGLGPKKEYVGRDEAEVYVLLQRRWEDEKGNIYANRVGTGRERYSKSVPWTKGHQIKINYGDITKEPYYKSYMGLLNGDKAYYAKNSKGKLVKVQEVGWETDPNAMPTHVLFMASSSCGTPFVGTVGNTLYIDNVAFVH